MQKPKQVLIKHHGFVIHNKPKESILIDPITQRTQVFASQRAAKWNASIYARLHSGFGYPTPSESTADAMLRLMEKRK
jgi:hypothetical protein